MISYYLVAGAVKQNTAITVTEREAEVAVRKWLVNCRHRDGLRNARGRSDARLPAETSDE